MPRPQVAELLVAAAENVRLIATEAEPWMYGWCVESYRRSGHAALHGREGPVTIVEPGLSAFDGAMELLLREDPVMSLWKADELWGVIATLVLALAETNERSTLVETGLRRVRGAGPSLVAVPIANVTWGGSPRLVGGGVVGTLGREFVTAVRDHAAGRRGLDSEDAKRWIDHQGTTVRRLANDGREQVPLVAAAF